MPDAADDEGPTGSSLVAGVELGGTKSIAVLARDAEIVESHRIPTTDPATTLGAMSQRLADWYASEPFAAIGIGSFGPVGVNPARADFGYVTNTPKPGWRDTDVRGHFAAQFDVPIGFDSDVAGAALAEGRWGASRGCAVHVYLTIGTGVGGGIVVDGDPVHGLVHPEVGHLRVRRRDGDTFAGACPFHGDCVEGLVAGPSIAARSGRRAEELDAAHPVWDDVAAELGELVALLILTMSPQRIVVGGGVGVGKPFLLDRVRRHAATVLGGYVAGLDDAAIRELVTPAALGDDAGSLGAIALGLDAVARS